MFTTVNEEVAALEKTLERGRGHQCPTCSIDDSTRRTQSALPSGPTRFTGTNIQKIEALFEGLKLVDSLEEKLEGVDMRDPSKQQRRIKDELRLAKLLGETALSKRMTIAYSARSSLARSE